MTATAKAAQVSRYDDDPKEAADKPAAKITRRSSYEDDPKDMRSNITQNKVDKLRKERAEEARKRQDSTDTDEDELCGPPCCTREIRQARKSRRFKLTGETPKYDDTHEPEAWLDDYLTVVRF